MAVIEATWEGRRVESPCNCPGGRLRSDIELGVAAVSGLIGSAFALVGANSESLPFTLLATALMGGAALAAYLSSRHVPDAARGSAV